MKTTTEKKGINCLYDESQEPLWYVGKTFVFGCTENIENRELLDANTQHFLDNLDCGFSYVHYWNIVVYNTVTFLFWGILDFCVNNLNVEVKC